MTNIAHRSEVFDYNEEDDSAPCLPAIYTITREQGGAFLLYLSTYVYDMTPPLHTRYVGIYYDFEDALDALKDYPRPQPKNAAWDSALTRIFEENRKNRA